MAESLTTKQAAKFLGCHEDTVYKLVREGKIKACNIGRGYRFLIDDLKAQFDYAINGDNSNVVDFGKRKLEDKKCQSINAGKRGVSTIPTQAGGEYASLLGLK